MTEREMLELAALAAGLKIDKSPCNGGGNWNTGFTIDGNAVLDWHNGTVWNPLTDDGDALRLAVKLGMSVKVDTRAGFSWIKRIEGSTPHNGDPYAATRLAITRAAAEIGKTIKEQQT